MKAMVLDAPHQPLVLRDLPKPSPDAGQVLIEVTACGVCRTDLHIVDGELPARDHGIVPGHEVVGIVRATGTGVKDIEIGQRVGVPWLGWTCGTCDYCRSGRENLCDRARFTGYDLPGGYAEFVTADARYTFPLPEGLPDAEAAPLLCAGLIGHRCLRKAGDARRIGIYGFGAAAHILAQVAHWEGRELYAFTRPGDHAAQTFARSHGALWAGGSDEPCPVALDAAVLFAPVGALVPAALRAVRKGGTVVCGGIHMSDIPSFPYEILWGERNVVSVANLTRADGEEFLEIAAAVPVRTTIETFALDDANRALESLRNGTLTGAAVLTPSSA
ncbi:MAG: zinc-binding alcohol dehydrogenase family protein [Betaproteobacteria bacterium]|nr:zinc-binding alcohol dehydrogenase family protein [Betaproteobacteria bacterium]